jgi:hypothetical protein
MGRRIARVVAILLLGITGVLGTYNGIDERANPYSLFQRVVYLGVVSYGVLGIIGVYGVMRRRGWSHGVVVAWALAITFVAGTAAMAYGGPEVTSVAGIAAGLGAALIGAFVVWAVRVA